jgi:F-type H+-transporting ATPase subunit delta
MAAVAPRYSRALVDVVTDKNPPLAPETARAELHAFLDAYKSSNDLRLVLANPAVSAPKKRALLERLGQAMALSRMTVNFLYVIADHRRMRILDEIVASFDALLDEKLGIARAQVTTAGELDPAARQKIEDALRRLTGKQVRAEYSVDPALIGGATTRVGSTVYDGSLRERLRQVRERLVSE